ncbi:hypothetical protein K505DRAFT_122011 [Melanomma pulvis-pyrius CBS 109.77]|uniref:Uncharacterized protein n=1 Tax=Melanomma pulvis-pyrius CBS 109.77 TaxID=1314802 RepID=A0A6A6WV49_9PLEO|nr:hypothetical protein K505DRAFT_122011 [Melanomma pulvis-pyrius CBS 109.77]
MPRAMRRPKRPHQQLLFLPNAIAARQSPPANPRPRARCGLARIGRQVEGAEMALGSRSGRPARRETRLSIDSGLVAIVLRHAQNGTLHQGASSIKHPASSSFMRRRPQSSPPRPCARRVVSAPPADVVCRGSIVHNGSYNKLNCPHARREFTRRNKQHHVRQAYNRLGAGDGDSARVQHGEQNE